MSSLQVAIPGPDVVGIIVAVSNYYSNIVGIVSFSGLGIIPSLPGLQKWEVEYKLANPVGVQASLTKKCAVITNIRYWQWKLIFVKNLTKELITRNFIFQVRQRVPMIISKAT